MVIGPLGLNGVNAKGKEHEPVIILLLNMVAPSVWGTVYKERDVLIAWVSILQRYWLRMNKNNDL